MTVVIASVESRFTIAHALAAVPASCGGIEHETIVVDASRDDSAAIAEGFGVSVVRRSPGTLTPVLWADGIRLSRGRWVALSTGHCILALRGVRDFVEALEAGAQGVGAGLLPASGARAVDRAVFFLRYNGFLDLTRGDVREVRDIPGDNAAYPGEAVRRFVEDQPEDGFWELEYHARVAGQGGRLVAVPSATARFGRSFPFVTILRHRFVHGRHFGAWRVREGGESRLRVAGPAPLVPFVLAVRAARAARPFGLTGALLGAVAPFLALGAAWGIGEAVGALFGSGQRA